VLPVSTPIFFASAAPILGND